MNGITSICICLLLWLTACTGTKSGRQADAKEIERISLTELNGQPIDLQKYKGKAIFINFWATWCRPCIQEMPSIAAMSRILENEPVVILLASNESNDLIESFANDHGYDFEYVRVDNMEDIPVAILPTTYIFDPEGELVFSEVGVRKWDDKTNLDILFNSIR